MRKNFLKSSIGFVFVCTFGLSLVSAQIFNPNRIHQLKSLKVVKVACEGHSIDAWVMDDESKNQEGMMFLTDKEVKENQGALFLFPTVQVADRYHGFWMHNTLIPLDIIYISPTKKVVSIAEGKVKDDTTLLAKGPYYWVLELKQGTAKKYGIKPGSKFQIPSNLKANY